MNQEIRVIVVGVASVTDEDPVLASAIELAARLGATLHAVHAYHLPEPIGRAYMRQVFLDRALLDRYGEQLRAKLEAQARSLGASADVVCHALEGIPSERVSEFAAEVEADLVIVGAARRGRLWRHLLGTTAEGVIRSAAVPVLVVRQPLERDRTRVLLTTDLSEASGAAHRTGATLAAALLGEHVDELRTLLVVQHDTAMPLPLRPDLLEAVAAEEMKRFLAEYADGVEVTPRIRLGEPAEQILDEAAEWRADLVVMGTHGRSGWHRFLLGSVSSGVLRGAPCNVLVIPAERLAASRRRAQVGATRRVPAPAGA